MNVIEIFGSIDGKVVGKVYGQHSCVFMTAISAVHIVIPLIVMALIVLSQR